MTQQIFVNLPVADLAKSKAFFEALGFGFNPTFTSDDAACLIIGDNIFAMLLVHGHFSNFTKKPIADANKTTEVLICLSRDSRNAVDSIVAKAAESGGKAHGEVQDHGFMYGHGFEDPDGHIWEVVHMSGPPPWEAAS